MKKYILAIDQSTTGSKAILVNRRGEVVNRLEKRHHQIYPQPKCIEHDPEELYQNVRDLTRDILIATDISPSDVLCLSICNQRETTVLWDKTGAPVHNAIVWQCTRSQEIIESPSIHERAEWITQKTGLPLSHIFSAGKAAWVMRNLAPQQPFFGTIDSWLIWRLTGNHRTDYSNASRTMLFNIQTGEWDTELQKIFHLTEIRLPQVKNSDDIMGYTTAGGIFREPIPVCGVLGDSHGALFSQGCWDSGTAKSTFGTGTSVMLNIGEKPIKANNSLTTTIAWSLSGRIHYALEGTSNFSGDIVRWLADDLGIIDDIALSSDLAQQVNSTEGVYFIPAFCGLGAPYWKPDVRASFFGMSRSTNKYHLIRAALEASAYRLRDIMDPMLDIAGIKLCELKVDGGLSNNEFLMQFVADILQMRIVRTNIEVLSALGAAYIGGLKLGFFSDKSEFTHLNKATTTYTPKVVRVQAEALYHGWRAAIHTLAY